MIDSRTFGGAEVTDIDIDERIEAILGPELTRKLDAYIAQEAEEGCCISIGHPPG